VADLEEIAGRGSALAQKYGLHFQHVTVAEVPDDYEERLTELFAGQFSRLRLLALEVHDLVLAKLARNGQVPGTVRQAQCKNIEATVRERIAPKPGQRSETRPDTHALARSLF